MLVPGQIPASEFVDVASPTGTSPQSEINGRRAVPPASGVVATDGPFPDSPELMLALSRAFNPACDRILWEGWSPDRLQYPSAVGSGERTGGRTASPIDLRDEALEIPRGWFSEVRCGSGLAVALGMAAARRTFGQEHWIVVVASADNVFRSLSHELIEQLQGVESRLLIVVVDDGQTLSASDRFPSEDGRVGQFDQLDARWLSELGLPCREPVTGRSTVALLAEFQQIVQMQSPVVLHIRVPAPPRLRSELPTESQGRGVLRLFGNSGQNTNVEAPSAGLDVVADELQILARTDKRVVAVVQDTLRSRFAFWRKQPDRNYPLPAAGRAPFTRSRGLAIGGCRPFLIVTGRYLQQSLDQLADQLCDSRQPVTLIVEPEDELSPTDHAGAVRQTSDLAYLRLLPETVVAVPRDERELRKLLRWSLQHAGPVAIQLPRRSATADFSRDDEIDNEPIEPGRAVVLEEGQDVALVALGSQVDLALRVADLLSEQGVSVGVVNARFVNPLDQSMLRRLARQVSGIVTLEDEPAHGGFGTAVLEQLATDGLSTPVLVSGALVPYEARHGEPQPGEDPGAAGVLRMVGQILEFIDRSLPQADEVRTREHDSSEWSELRAFDVSADALRTERESILAQPLSAAVEAWVAEYAKVGQRPKYLWQWCQRGVELTTLPCVLPEWRSDVCDSKVLSIMINVLLDDVADRQGAHVLLEELLQITRGHSPDTSRLTAEEQHYAAFVQAMWAEYWGRASRYPNFNVFGDLLQYDLSQLFNTIRYSNLLNRNPHLLNMVEHDLYSPHSMMQMSFATIDLSCTADFPWDELGKLREAIWHAQCMGRIGNLVTTWQREIPCRDFTSGVFAHAVTAGDLTVGDLLHAEPEQIEAAIHRGGHEDHFLKEWKYHLRRLHALRRRFHAFDLGNVIQGLKQLLVTELASRGRK